MPPPFATIQQRYALLAIYNEAAPTVRQIVNDVRFGSTGDVQPKTPESLLPGAKQT
jgi:hypothetical protein